MEAKPHTNASKPRSLAQLDFPSGEGPRPHPVRVIDPRAVEAHFATLPTHRPGPRERWSWKAQAMPFPGL